MPSRDSVTWDILIASVAELLAELQRQLAPGVGVIVFRDNITVAYGDKCQQLVDSSNAEYVSFLDDDDWIEPDFIATILNALRKKPDYVGFNVRYTESGVPQQPVYHTLKYNGWVNNPEALYRDIVHFNPIRRELALLSRWQGGAAADIHWADGLRNLGCVRDEVYIDREMYHYRPNGSFRVPPAMDSPPPCPEFDFVTWIGEQ